MVRFGGEEGTADREQVTAFLTTMENFAEMNSVYEKYFTHKPSRSCVAVKELPSKFLLPKSFLTHFLAKRHFVIP